MHLENIRAAWEFLENHDDDLHMFALDPIENNREDSFWSIPNIIDDLENGPFEDEDRF